MLWSAALDSGRHKKSDDPMTTSRLELSFLHGFRWCRTSLSLPLIAMYFAMLLLNTMLRDTKDTMLVMSKAGVEAIPILKTWVVIPCSILFFMGFSSLSARLSKRRLFVAVIGGFVVFYIVFCLFLYPFRHSLAPTRLSAWMRRSLPRNMLPYAAIVDEWILGLFYVVCELWASAVCSLLFWQVANDVISVDEAKSVYPIIGVAGNVGMVVAGALLRRFADQRDVLSASAYLRVKRGENATSVKTSPPGDPTGVVNRLRGYEKMVERAMDFSVDPESAGWARTLMMIATALSFAALAMLLCYDAVYERRNRHNAVRNVGSAVMTPSAEGAPTGESTVCDLERNGTETKPNWTEDGEGGSGHIGALSKCDNVDISPWPTRRLNLSTETDGAGQRCQSRPRQRRRRRAYSFLRSLETLSHNRPLRCIASLVVSYGISSSLLEVSWKGQVKHLYTSPNDYSRFMASFWQWTGLGSMLFMLLGRYMLRTVGYRAVVLFTPVLMSGGGLLFFSVGLAQLIRGEAPGTGFLAGVAAYTGGGAVLVSKAAKYAFFDATKEIMFIPLDRKAQSIGKAAIDVVAYRFAKSGGSVYLQVVIFAAGSLDAGVLFVLVAFSAVMVLWSYAAHSAGIIMQGCETTSPRRQPQLPRDPVGTTPRSAIREAISGEERIQHRFPRLVSTGEISLSVAGLESLASRKRNTEPIVEGKVAEIEFNGPKDSGPVGAPV